MFLFWSFFLWSFGFTLFARYKFFVGEDLVELFLFYFTAEWFIVEGLVFSVDWVNGYDGVSLLFRTKQIILFWFINFFFFSKNLIFSWSACFHFFLTGFFFFDLFLFLFLLLDFFLGQFFFLFFFFFFHLDFFLNFFHLFFLFFLLNLWGFLGSFFDIFKFLYAIIRLYKIFKMIDIDAYFSFLYFFHLVYRKRLFIIGFLFNDFRLFNHLCFESKMVDSVRLVTLGGFLLRTSFDTFGLCNFELLKVVFCSNLPLMVNNVPLMKFDAFKVDHFNLFCFWFFEWRGRWLAICSKQEILKKVDVFLIRKYIADVEIFNHFSFVWELTSRELDFITFGGFLLGTSFDTFALCNFELLKVIFCSNLPLMVNNLPLMKFVFLAIYDFHLFCFWFFFFGKCEHGTFGKQQFLESVCFFWGRKHIADVEIIFFFRERGRLISRIEIKFNWEFVFNQFFHFVGQLWKLGMELRNSFGQPVSEIEGKLFNDVFGSVLEFSSFDFVRFFNDFFPERIVGKFFKGQAKSFGENVVDIFDQFRDWNFFLWSTFVGISKSISLVNIECIGSDLVFNIFDGTRCIEWTFFLLFFFLFHFFALFFLFLEDLVVDLEMAFAILSFGCFIGAFRAAALFDFVFEWSFFIFERRCDRFSGRFEETEMSRAILLIFFLLGTIRVLANSWRSQRFCSSHFFFWFSLIFGYFHLFFFSLCVVFGIILIFLFHLSSGDDFFDLGASNFSFLDRSGRRLSIFSGRFRSLFVGCWCLFVWRGLQGRINTIIFLFQWQRSLENWDFTWEILVQVFLWCMMWHFAWIAGHFTWEFFRSFIVFLIFLCRFLDRWRRFFFCRF